MPSFPTTLRLVYDKNFPAFVSPIGTTPANLPFATPIGQPQDESGAPLPAYAAQAVALKMIGSNLNGPATNQAPNTTYTWTVTMDYNITFTTSGGQSLGALSGTGTTTLQFQRDFNGNAYGASGTASNQVFSTPGPTVTNTNFGGVLNTGTQGLVLGVGSEGYSLEFYSPFYLLNLPYGATATATITFTPSSVTSTGSMVGNLRYNRIPNSTATLASDATLSATKFVTSTTNRWTTPDVAGNENGGALAPIYTAAAWDAYYLESGQWRHATATPNGDTASFALDFDTAGSKTAYVRVTNTDGFIGWASATATVAEPETTTGALALPSGALLSPGTFTSGATPIVRFTEGVGNQTIGTVQLKSVHLMRHEGESTIYAGGVSGGAIQLHQSSDSGATSTMTSVAIPSGHKLVRFRPLWGGGFGVLSTSGTGLYTTRSMDGTNWSTPLLVYSVASGTPKGDMEQMMVSGESHIYISDGQTYSIRNDDNLQTAGTRLF